MAQSKEKIPNALISESSPYLLQHAYNPVNWFPWGQKALQKAKAEDKPILVSIGYAACHWCHVMERECFENSELAAIMNEFFICIKVDREERPDIDDIYMNAVQLMGQQGGWPLNVFLTPDEKPFYGGTYFPPSQWKQVLLQIQKAYSEKRDKINESAEQVARGLQSNQSFQIEIDSSQPIITRNELDEAYKSIAKRFDHHHGGLGNAPKFPMPGIYDFLLRYQQAVSSDDAAGIVYTTLTKMAWGGIFDHVDGGFARYSTDDRWLVPHFEKMLYDNAQLIALYSRAYRIDPNPLYKHVVAKTIRFCEEELKGNAGNYFSSLDADSEGEEGKYYVWRYQELQKLLGDDFKEFERAYDVTPDGNWEGQIVLERNPDYDTSFEQIERWNHILKSARKKRVKPGLDDKTLTGWNGLMISGLCEAYKSFGNDHYRLLAKETGQFIHQKLMTSSGKLFRNYKDGSASIDGMLEDYATTIEGFIQLYEITFEQQWLDLAMTLFQYTEDHFLDKEDQFYFYTDQNASRLIARRKDIQDNVIPSSNSIMARNLYHLGLVYGQETLTTRAESMAARLKTVTLPQSSFMSGWALLLTDIFIPTSEVIVIGPESDQLRQDIQAKAPYSTIFMGGKETPELPLAEGKTAISGKTTIYVCKNKTCQTPVHTAKEALGQF